VAPGDAGIGSALKARPLFRGFPAWGFAGLLLIAVCWPLNWSLPGLRTHLLFFPLWLGYTLLADGLAFRRAGTSILARSPVRFAALFVLSIPVWWMFEAINRRTGNWLYLGRDEFSNLEYFLFGSLAFSTVIPAVMTTMEALQTVPLLRRAAGATYARTGPGLAVACIASGALMLTLLLAWPRVFYPFAWTSLFLLLDPVNSRLTAHSLVAELGGGVWRTVAALALAGLVCGFFWELWNVQACPKWTYDTPGFNDWRHLFEMPLPGYLGYVPFAWELFAITTFAGRLLGRVHPSPAREH
jgi:hypothetical protein